MCAYTYIHTHMFVRACTSLCIHIDICARVCAYVCMRELLHVCVYICVWVCVCTCVCKCVFAHELRAQLWRWVTEHICVFFLGITSTCLTTRYFYFRFLVGHESYLRVLFFFCSLAYHVRIYIFFLGMTSTSIRQGILPFLRWVTGHTSEGSFFNVRIAMYAHLRGFFNITSTCKTTNIFPLFFSKSLVIPGYTLFIFFGLETCHSSISMHVLFKHQLSLPLDKVFPLSFSPQSRNLRVFL